MAINVRRGRFRSLRARLFGLEAGSELIPRIEKAVDEARHEWLSARRYFDCVSDPDLVDQAIYTMEAAERKYIYLLRLAKTSEAAVLH